MALAPGDQGRLLFGPLQGPDIRVAGNGLIHAVRPPAVDMHPQTSALLRTRHHRAVALILETG
jgi:hypothetical protein